MTAKPKVLILTGCGVNGEAEARFAWEQAGAAPELVHLLDFFEQPNMLRKFQALMLAAGASFGGNMGAGHVLALRLRRRASEDMLRFIEAGGLVLGVNDGFNAMVKLGLLPGLDGDYSRQRLALTMNDCGTFVNRWVMLRFEADSPCVFTKGLDFMPLPIRHAEGRVFVKDRDLLARIEQAGCVACRYANPNDGEIARDFPDNPSGSMNAIAGLCDPTGRVFGLMPNPDGYLFPENHPNWDFQKHEALLPKQGLGLRLFTNAVSCLKAS